MSGKKEKPLGWQDLEVGYIVTQAGSASQYKTGDWRSQRPLWDHDKCIKCGICYIFCPDICIVQTQEGYFDADLFYCKGCGICARECLTGAVQMVEEEE